MTSATAQASPDGHVPAQELRIAATFTGGVSLAVWMGGVANEINMLAAASRHPEPDASTDPWTTGGVATRYRRLLRLLQVDVSVDVLSGTSAGGINAAVLGLALARDRDLVALRSVWLDEGELGSLLHVPGRQPAPASLLQGDSGLLTGLQEGIRKIAGSGTTSAAAAVDTRAVPTGATPVHVFITTTLLAGQRSGFRDDFDTLVDDADHHGLFAFDAAQLVDDAALRPLALAARCSASFPAAFEPGYVPVHEQVGTLPDMAPYTGLTRSCWVADGGLLNNRPLRPALEAVFDRPAGQDVRRVLAFVVPSASMPQTDTAEFAKPFGLGRALLADLGAATSQTIADELRDIRQHNDDVSGLEQTRDALLRAGGPAEPLRVDAKQFVRYRVRRAGSIVGPVARAVERRWADDGAAARPGSLPASELRRAAEALLLEPTAADRPWSRGDLRLPGRIPDAGDHAALAAFGRQTYDGARAVVLSLVRQALGLAGSPGARRDLLELRREVGDGKPARTLSPAVLRDLVRRLDDTGPTREVLVRAVAAWVDQAHNRDKLAASWQRLADQCSDDRLRSVLAGAGQDTPAGRMRDHLAVPPNDVAVRLFRLVLVSHAVTSGGPELEQKLELVQMSADTRTLLDARSRAGDKLTGLQAHHFGAFYKRSWRANDWMWGRLDGVGWLVHLLLDPRRVLEIAEAQPDPRAWILGRFRSELTEVAGCAPTPEARAQLEVLASCTPRPPTGVGDPPQPQNLAGIALWVAQGAQRLVAREELPWVAQQASLDMQDGGGRRRETRAFVDACRVASTPAESSNAPGPQSRTAARRRPAARRPPGRPVGGPETKSPRPLKADADPVHLLQLCLVSKEKLPEERPTPMFLRTVTQALAVTAGIAADKGARVKPAGPTLLALRGMTTLAWRASRVAGRTVLTGAVLAVAGMLVATSNYAVLSGLGVIATGAGILILAVRSAGAGQRRWQAGVALSAGVLFAVFLLCTAAAFTWSRPYLERGLQNAADYLPNHPVVWALVALFVLLPPLTTVADLVLKASRWFRLRPR